MATTVSNAVSGTEPSHERKIENPYAVMGAPDQTSSWKPATIEERLWQFVCAVLLLVVVAVLLLSGLMIAINGLLELTGELSIFSPKFWRAGKLVP